MKRIIFAWELGAGYGHIFHLLPVAVKMAAKGFKPYFILKDLSRTEKTIGPHGFPVLQAPVWLAKAVGMPPPVTFPDILFRAGYFNVEGLTAMLKAWIHLFDLIKPHLIVADHSPSALLAAKALNLPKVIIGNSFTIPPRAFPLPPLAPNVDRQTVLKREKLVLDKINQALARLNIAPLEQLNQIFDADETFLCTFAELDHYGYPRTDVKYYGPGSNPDAGVVPEWPKGNGNRIFCYIYPTFKGFRRIIKALAKTGCSTIVHAPGLSRSQRKELATDTIYFADEIVNIKAIAKECDGAICHSGAGTGTFFLLSGCPVLLVPLQLEQTIAAKKIVELGAGIMVRPEARKRDYRKAINVLIEDSSMHKQAREFAMRYRQVTPEKSAEEIANRCALLTQ